VIPVLHQVGNAAIWTAFVAAAAFCAVYAAMAPWWKSSEGRHLMTFTAILAVAFGWLCLRLILGPIPVEIPRAVLLGALALSLIWRLVLLIRNQMPGRRQ
jgi:hypothetical protein